VHRGEKIMQTKEIGIRQRMTDMGRSWNTAKLTKTTTFWIAIGAIVLVLYLGFARAGWVTDGTALQRAEVNAQGAVVERLAPICVAQFNQDAERGQKLGEFKELTTSTQRATFVKEQGWATMPGETGPDNRVATECANQIMLVGE
jgi:hypothetical protein